MYTLTHLHLHYSTNRGSTASAICNAIPSGSRLQFFFPFFAFFALFSPSFFLFFPLFPSFSTFSTPFPPDFPTISRSDFLFSPTLRSSPFPVLRLLLPSFFCTLYLYPYLYLYSPSPTLPCRPIDPGEFRCALGICNADAVYYSREPIAA